jgi:hypothetical protein
MSWIKRNLYFVIGSVIALVLMGMAGWYSYSKWALNSRVMEQLNEQYAELDKLNRQNPHPGSAKVDNTKAAKEMQVELRNFIKKTDEHFKPIPPIPPGPKVTDQEFTAALRRTIAQLQRGATNSSVSLPPGYYFSFEAQKPKMTFEKGSLEPLAAQLGEVKAICDILFQARINSLDYIRRERITTDDLMGSGLASDYVDAKSVTNDLAVLAPFEVSFFCFSSELASVLAGFGSSPHALLINTINVEHPLLAGAADQAGIAGEMAPPGVPTGAYPAAPQTLPRAAEGEYMRRYGPLGGRPPGMPPGFAAPTPAPLPGAAPAAKGGLPTVLDEKPLKVTLAIVAVKRLAPK